MEQPLAVLKNARIAAPCSQPWHQMEGSDRVRYCKACKLNVYNLSEMTAREAAALIQTTEGRLCIGYYMRADGSIITRNCPIGLRRIRKRLAWAVSAAAVVLGLSLSALGALTHSSHRFSLLRAQRPFRQIVDLLDPPKAFLAGIMASPPPPNK